MPRKAKLSAKIRKPRGRPSRVAILEALAMQAIRERGVHVGYGFGHKVARFAENAGVPYSAAFEIFEKLHRRVFEEMLDSARKGSPVDSDPHFDLAHGGGH